MKGEHAPESESESAVELAGRLHSLAIHVLRRARPADAESELSAARLSALSVLVFGGPRGLGELAEAEQVTAPTMSRLVKALERSGYVERRPDPSDGRRVVLRATDAGRSVLETARGRRIELLEGLVAELGSDARHAVGEAIGLLEAELSRG